MIINDYIEIHNYTNSFIKMPSSSKFFKSSEFNERLNVLLQGCYKRINGVCIQNINDILTGLNNYTKIFIKGGLIRDLIHDKQVTDIDIQFLINTKYKRRGCTNMYKIKFTM